MDPALAPVNPTLVSGPDSIGSARIKTDEDRSMANWTISDSLDLYNVLNWGSGFFAINDAGDVEVRPKTGDERSIDLLELVENLGRRGVHTPLLIRFNDILDSRVRGLNECFDHALAEADYQGVYTCVYPIKVNQQRHICEGVRDLGESLGFGLEAGSKAELLAGLALTEGHNSMLFICNGFKDEIGRAHV